jgi:DNA-binding response OmpR family regulator
VKTVMLVEDESMMRRLVEITLGSGRYHVLHAKDGETGLRLAGRVRVDLALVDVTMPGLDGFTVCQRLKALPADVRPSVVMLSSRAGPSDRARGRFAGADDYVAKPFSPLALLDCVQGLLSPAAPTPAQGLLGSRAA